MTRQQQTRRWWFAGFVAVFGGVVGVLTGRTAPLLVGMVGVVYVIYTGTGPATGDVEISRSLSDTEPNPGETVTVTVTVENTGGPIADLRLIDGVPQALEVVDDSPRRATALARDDELSYSYSIRAERGQHGFDPMTVITRNPSGAIEDESTVDTETIITCQPPLSDVPLRSQTTHYTGRITTDTGGSGIEFHATREYRPGDPLSRIDWNQRARTGELTTVEFREERAATVMLVIDARTAAYWMPAPQKRHAVSHAVAAAGRVFAHLLDGGDRVGLTTWGDEACWLAPGSGSDHEHEARRLLATHPALSYAPPDANLPELSINPDHDAIDVSRLLNRLNADTQLFIVSPVCDDASADAAQQLAGHNRSVTVISPDVTTDDTPGRQLAQLQRANRLDTLRESNIRVVDWDVTTPFTAVLAGAEVSQ